MVQGTSIIFAPNFSVYSKLNNYRTKDGERTNKA